MLFNFYNFCSRYLNSIICFIFIINLYIQSGRGDFLGGETGLVELLQVFFISLSLITIVINKKIFSSFYKGYLINLKIIFLFILLYEENSFLTAYKFDFAKKLNNQSEINFHNSYFFNSYSFNIPFFSEDVYLSTLIKISAVLFICFGSRFQIFRKLRLFLFEKKFSFFGYIYLLNFLISPITRYFDIPLANKSQSQIFDDELIELLFYILLFLDSFSKRLKKKTIN